MEVGESKINTIHHPFSKNGSNRQSKPTMCTMTIKSLFIITVIIVYFESFFFIFSALHFVCPCTVHIVHIVLPSPDI